MVGVTGVLVLEGTVVVVVSVVLVELVGAAVGGAEVPVELSVGPLVTGATVVTVVVVSEVGGAVGVLWVVGWVLVESTKQETL